MAQTKNWYEVDREGLRKLVEGRSKAFILFELWQNAIDAEGTKTIEIEIQPLKSRPVVEVIVRDDAPDGFKDLTHAYTLFAESEKKGKLDKRGRFNLGEKLVLAVCESATIVSTAGGFRFDAEGRHVLRKRSESGSEFRGLVRMPRTEVSELVKAAKRLICPPGVVTRLRVWNAASNEWAHATPDGWIGVGERGEPLKRFRGLLPTIKASADGVLRPDYATADIAAYAPLPGEKAHVYELGIPVCEIDLPWDVDVHQKVPLAQDRETVTPSFLRDIRVAVMNAMHERLTPAQAAEPWVQAATGDPCIDTAALVTMKNLRFGADAVAQDPSDREGEKISQSQGRQVIYGGHLTADQWEQLKSRGLILPAGQVTPSRPSPTGSVAKYIPPSEQTPAMRNIVRYVARIAEELIGQSINVTVCDNPDWSGEAASWEETTLTMRLNVGRLGRDWFAGGRRSVAVNDIVIHELAHHYAPDHLSADFHGACSKLGAQLVARALIDSEIWEDVL